MKIMTAPGDAPRFKVSAPVNAAPAMPNQGRAAREKQPCAESQGDSAALARLRDGAAGDTAGEGSHASAAAPTPPAIDLSRYVCLPVCFANNSEVCLPYSALNGGW